MKIVTVVGARPQFIKAAAVSRKLREGAQEILVHTGQHYDRNMSDIFFEELNIPKPDFYLGVGSGSHAVQTAGILVGTEEIYEREKPDYVLVYGDTNSTLAAALAAAKLLIPVIHVEAGLRSFNKAMPEEQNRILTDHISKYLFCPTDTALRNLVKENIAEEAYQVGDVMCDALHYYLNRINESPEWEYIKKLKYLFEWNKHLDRWYIATVHRAENTRNIDVLSEIMAAFEELDAPVLLPVHPRIRHYIIELMKEHQYGNICFVEPLSYLEMLYFTSHAVKVITDSGGLQKEAYMLKRYAVTLREQTEWVETLSDHHNILCRIKKEEIINSILRNDLDKVFDESLFGNGHAAEKICKILFS